jgi:hypothetical protein
MIRGAQGNLGPAGGPGIVGGTNPSAQSPQWYECVAHTNYLK